MHDVLPLLACNTNASKEPLTLPDLHQSQGVLPLATLQDKRVVCYHATHAQRTDTHEYTGVELGDILQKNQKEGIFVIPVSKSSEKFYTGKPTYRKNTGIPSKY